MLKSGAASSTILTRKVLTLAFELPSVAVTVTSSPLGLMSSQSNTYLESTTVGTPQLSVALDTKSALVMVTVPSVPRLKFFGADKSASAGRVVSDTVTIDVVVAVLPEPSVAVKVTVFAPMSEQLKVELLKVTVGVPQLSADVRSTSAFVMEAEPVASR